ncbi:MAG: hypothetical protein CMI52_03265 [Parcubacteria group bacterium]|nr:hypothetical protein [Parcubacteria group bacterium]|tara:strand:- start:1271 stop:1531 length:261 start_codon:yes stop_codon:yes gene_type:complete
MAKKSKRNNHSYGVHRLGLFFVAVFTLCFFWGLVNTAEPILHMSLMKLSFIGFEGFDSVSYFYGAVQVYLWAWIYGFAWHSIMPKK